MNAYYSANLIMTLLRDGGWLHVILKYLFLPIILGEICLLQNTKFHLELENVNRIKLIVAQLVNKYSIY